MLYVFAVLLVALIAVCVREVLLRYSGFSRRVLIDFDAQKKTEQKGETNE